MARGKVLCIVMVVVIVLSTFVPVRTVQADDEIPPLPEKNTEELLAPPVQAAPSISIENSFIKAYSSSSGRFNVGTTGGDPGTTSDNYKRMLYGYPSSVGTSFSTLRVQDSTSVGDYRLGGDGLVPLVTPYVSGGAMYALYERSSVRVQEKISFATNPDTGRADMIVVEYQLTNRGSTNRSAGIRVMLDTMIGSNDGAPIFAPGWGRITQETDIYTAPDYWIAWESASFDPSYLIAKSQLNGANITRPNKLQVAAWPYVYGSLWNYTTNPTRSITSDSAVLMYYDPTMLAPGQTRTIRFSYGISNKANGLQLAPDIDQFIYENNALLEEIAQMSVETATVGDYFLDQFQEDMIDGIVDLAFNGFELATAGVSWSRVGKGVQHIATPGFRASKYASWLKWTDNAAERHWGKAVYDAWQGNRKVLTNELMDAGVEYFAREAGREAVSEFTAYSAQRLTPGPGTPVAELFGLPAQRLGRSYQSSLLAERDLLMTQLAVMNLSSSELAAIRQDMQARLAANRMIVRQLREHRNLLWNEYQQAKADEDNWLNFWTPLIAKYAVIGVCTALWDGPGFYMSSLGTTATETILNGVSLARNLKTDYQMFLQSLGLLKGRISINYIELSHNTLAELNLIRARDIPEIASAVVNGPTMLSFGEERYWPLNIWVEHSSEIRFQISNPNWYESSYLTSAAFTNTSFWSGSERFFFEGQSVDLPGGYSSVVAIPLKSREIGITPDGNAAVQIDVLATSDTGLYPGSSFTLYWNPIKILYSASPGLSAAELAAQAVNAELPSVPFPLASETGNIYGTQDYQMVIQVNNPFDIAVNAVVTQELPAGVTLVDPAGAAVPGQNLSWSFALQPHTQAELRPVLHWSGAPGQALAIPTPQLQFTDPNTGLGDSYTGNVEQLEAAWPLIASAGFPERWKIGATVPLSFSLRNVASTGYSGSILVRMTSANGVVRWTREIPFSASASSEQTINAPFVVPPLMEVLNFDAVITINGTQREIFSDLVQVEGYKTYLPVSFR